MSIFLIVDISDKENSSSLYILIVRNVSTYNRFDCLCFYLQNICIHYFSLLPSIQIIMFIYKNFNSHSMYILVLLLQLYYKYFLNYKFYLEENIKIELISYHNTLLYSLIFLINLWKTRYKKKKMSLSCFQEAFVNNN